MAAATNVAKPLNNVDGMFREKVYPAVTIAASGDFLNTGFKTIFMISVSNTALVTGFTTSGGMINFTSTGGGTFSLEILGR